MKTKEAIEAQMQRIIFKFQISDIVKPMPFYQNGELIMPKPEERYRIVARAWTEGISLQSIRIKQTVVYHCLPIHTAVTKKMQTDTERVKVVPQTDEMGRPFLELYSDPKISISEIKDGSYSPACND